MTIRNGQLLDTALCYAELGYRVFPISAGKKYPPKLKAWQHKATTDVGQIERWWTKWPAAYIGIATAGFLVVDPDVDDAGKGNPWPADPQHRFDLGLAPTVITPRGGRHHLFADPHCRFLNSASKLAPHVDTRTDGGYIVAPPSVRREGSYRSAEGLELDCGPDDLPPVPDWLIEALTIAGRKEGESDLNEVLEQVVDEGQRNNSAAQLAGRYFARGMNEAEVLLLVNAWNKERCRPPLDTAEVHKVVESIGRTHQANGAKKKAGRVAGAQLTLA